MAAGQIAAVHYDLLLLKPFDAEILHQGFKNFN